MKPNVHPLDRIVRIVLAIIIGIAIAAKAITGGAALVSGIAALILFLTGLVGFCGIYAILGISTCAMPKKGQR